MIIAQKPQENRKILWFHVSIFMLYASRRTGQRFCASKKGTQHLSWRLLRRGLLSLCSLDVNATPTWTFAIFIETRTKRVESFYRSSLGSLIWIDFRARRWQARHFISRLSFYDRLRKVLWPSHQTSWQNHPFLAALAFGIIFSPSDLVCLAWFSRFFLDESRLRATGKGNLPCAFAELGIQVEVIHVIHLFYLTNSSIYYTH